MLKEFRKFILRGNVVDLAVGIVIGAAFTSVVNALVKDVITPLIALIYNDKQFSDNFVTIHNTQFLYGDLLNNLISFVIVAAVVFFIVVEPINKLTDLASRGKGDKEPTEKTCPYCLSTVPKAAAKCRFCTSSLKKESEKENK